MPKIITCLNSKGGVGKTTLCVALAEYFSAELKHKVLVIDLDWQTNATTMLMDPGAWKKYNDEKKTLPYVLRALISGDEEVRFSDFILKNRTNIRPVLPNGQLKPPPLDILPGSPDMDDLEIDIIRKYAHLSDSQFAKILIELFRKQFESLSGYRYIFIDCPPKFDIFTRAISEMFSLALIPFSHHRLTIYGLNRVVSRLARIRRQEEKQVPYLAVPNRIRNLAQASPIIDEVPFKVSAARIMEGEQVARNGEFFFDPGGRLTWHAKWGTSASQQFRRIADEILGIV